MVPRLGGVSVEFEGACLSHHLHFQRNPAAGTLLLRVQKIQAFKPDNLSATIFDEHDIVGRFLADVFFLRIVEPDAQGVADPVVVDSHFFLISSFTV